jgi:hypothetical protein
MFAMFACQELLDALRIETCVRQRRLQRHSVTVCQELLDALRIETGWHVRGRSHRRSPIADRWIGGKSCSMLYESRPVTDAALAVSIGGKSCSMLYESRLRSWRWPPRRRPSASWQELLDALRIETPWKS